jgi:uncharacterized membrane protein
MMLKMTNNYLGAGMGTSGLVGPLAAFATMREAGATAVPLAIKIVCLYFVAPAVIALLIHWGMKKIGWVKDGDMKLHP